MSRTYRRKDRKPPRWVTHEWNWMMGGFIQRIAREGDDLKRELAKYHSDHQYNETPSVWWRQNEWSKVRSQSKRELERWLKNEEYEVQLRNNPRWPYWD